MNEIKLGEKVRIDGGNVWGKGKESVGKIELKSMIWYLRKQFLAEKRVLDIET